MRDVPDLIDALGGSLALATATGKPIGTVSAWKTRKSIPVEHWRAVIASAATKKLTLTADDLVRLHVGEEEPALPDSSRAERDAPAALAPEATA